MTPRSVAVLAFDEISPYHLSVPTLVFGEDRSADGIPRYDVRVCAAGPGPVRTTAGYTVGLEHDLSAVAGAETVIVPSWRRPGSPVDPELVAAIQTAHAAGARVVGLCLGAFVLAETGILDGRRATTHWRWADQLAEMYPGVEVDAGVLWVDHGDAITSAGTAAAIDCCVHLVRSDHGPDVANRLARRLVVAPHRFGNQAQFVERPTVGPADGDEIGDIVAWMREHIAEPVTIDRLAEQFHVSRRTLTRHFRASVGSSPLQWLLNERIARAQELLEATTLPVEAVAQRCGLGSAVSMRQHFQRLLDISPQAYRKTFRRSA